MATLINMCPNCKSNDVKKIRKGKYTVTALGLIIVGLPLLLLGGFGLIFIVIGIVMGCIAETTYKCLSCKAEWK